MVRWQAPRASGRGGGKGVFKAAESFLRWAKKHGSGGQRHVFHGEINRRGNAVGYHHRHGGRDREGVRVVGPRENVLPNGTYQQRVEIWDGNSWVNKTSGPPPTGGSTFFPDHWTPEQVNSAIDDAFRNPTTVSRNGKWRGTSGGITIEGYGGHGSSWSTAWPVQ